MTPAIERRAWAWSDLPWAAWRFARKGVVSLVPISGHLWLARARGRAASRLSGIPDHVRENLQSTLAEELDPPELDRIARRYRAFTKRMYLTRVLPRLPGFDDPSRWPVRGLEHLDRALERERGAILATAHVGYARLVAPVLRTHGYEVKDVVAGLSDRVADRETREAWLGSRTRFGRYVYERTRVVTDLIGPQEIVAGLDIRPILAELSDNRCVLIAGDGFRALEFVRLPLFDRIYPFPAGFMKISTMTGAPVLPVFAVDSEQGLGIGVEVGAPLPTESEATVAENVRTFARAMEGQLRRTPHLWWRWGANDPFGKALEWSEGRIEQRYREPWR